MILFTYIGKNLDLESGLSVWLASSVGRKEKFTKINAKLDKFIGGSNGTNNQSQSYLNLFCKSFFCFLKLYQKL